MKNFFVLAAVVGLVACNNTGTETEGQVQDTVVVAVDSTTVVIDTTSTVVETEVAE